MFGLANTRISTDYAQNLPGHWHTRKRLGVCVWEGMGSNLAPQQIDLSESNANVGPLKLIKRSGFIQYSDSNKFRTSENPVSVRIRLPCQNFDTVSGTRMANWALKCPKIILITARSLCSYNNILIIIRHPWTILIKNPAS